MLNECFVGAALRTELLILTLTNGSQVSLASESIYPVIPELLSITGSGKDSFLRICSLFEKPHAIRCWMGGKTPREELASLDLLGIEGDLDGWLEQLAEP